MFNVAVNIIQWLMTITAVHIMDTTRCVIIAIAALITLTIQICGFILLPRFASSFALPFESVLFNLEEELTTGQPPESMSFRLTTLSNKYLNLQPQLSS